MNRFKYLISYVLFSFFLYLNKFKLFNSLNRILLDVYLAKIGYCTHFQYIIGKSKNSLFLGEIIFIKKFKELNILNCIDVGANIGEYSLEILKNQNNSKVIAFEPLPMCCTMLSSILKNYPDRFSYHEIALSNKNGRAIINYSLEKSGLSSLETKINEISYVANSNINKIEVLTKKLDDFRNEKKFQNIDFIKIDVEGHEMSVLDGSINFILEKKIKIIQLEYNLHQLITSSTIYMYSQKLTNYKVFQLNLLDGKLRLVDPLDPLSNLNYLSNFIFIESEYYKTYREILLT